MLQHLGNQEDSHDWAAGRGGWSAASSTLNSPHLPHCPCLWHSTPPQLAAGRVHHAHLFQMSPLQTTATSILCRWWAGQRAGCQVPFLGVCLKGLKGPGREPCPCRGLGGPGSNMEQTERCVMTFQQKHVVGAGLCQGVSWCGWSEGVTLSLGVSALGGDCCATRSSSFSSAAHLFPVKATQSVNVAEAATFSARILKRKETDVMWKRNGK